MHARPCPQDKEQILTEVREIIARQLDTDPNKVCVWGGG